MEIVTNSLQMEKPRMRTILIQGSAIRVPARSAHQNSLRFISRNRSRASSTPSSSRRVVGSCQRFSTGTPAAFLRIFFSNFCISRSSRLSFCVMSSPWYGFMRISIRHVCMHVTWPAFFSQHLPRFGSQFFPRFLSQEIPRFFTVEHPRIHIGLFAYSDK